MILAGIAALTAITFLLKGLVPLTRPLPESYRHRLGGLAPALLAAFVVTQLLDDEGVVSLDARAAGVAVAVLLNVAKAPLGASVIAAAVATAALRTAGVG